MDASTQDNSDEMKGIAGVLVRQRDVWGYSDIATFASSEPSYSFVTSDGNARYQKVMKATYKPKNGARLIYLMVQSINGFSGQVMLPLLQNHSPFTRSAYYFSH